MLEADGENTFSDETRFLVAKLLKFSSVGHVLLLASHSDEAKADRRQYDIVNRGPTRSVAIRPELPRFTRCFAQAGGLAY